MTLTHYGKINAVIFAAYVVIGILTPLHILPLLIGGTIGIYLGRIMLYGFDSRNVPDHMKIFEPGNKSNGR